jgi:hypothetical protein
MLQNYAFQAGSKGRIINAKATFFRYEAGSAQGDDVGLKVRAGNDDLGTYYPGDAIELPVPAAQWEILPISDTCSGTIRVGVGRVQSARLSGTVQVIDAARASALANREFVSSINVGAGAGLFSTGEIWNGSTDKGLSIRGFSIVSDIAQTVNICGVTAELAAPNVVTLLNPKRIASVAGAGPASIRRNSRNLSNVSEGAGTTVAFFPAGTGGIPREFPMYGAPIVVGPGSGIRFASMSAAASLGIILASEVFDW